MYTLKQTVHAPKFHLFVYIKTAEFPIKLLLFTFLLLLADEMLTVQVELYWGFIYVTRIYRDEKRRNRKS